MKMVKSLLLGSAAGLVAVTSGQAADLPVKAKPVEYVKVCNLYGAGFYYMPGTDLCLKVGGWVRAEGTWGSNGSLTNTPFYGQLNQRGTNNLTFRARGYVTVDAREQTAYGTARGYLAVGLSTSDVGLNGPANQFSANRAFVQFAGLTAGITGSFYDFYQAAAANYRAAYFPGSDTSDPGWTVFGYTAQLGNGLSTTVSMEARRTTQIVNVGNDTTAPGGVFTGTGGANGALAPGSFNSALTGAAANTGAALAPGNGAYGGQQLGDIVGNIRLDQAWGGAQVMGALHKVNASYYATASSGNPSVLSGANPGNAWGYAVGAGLRLNFPMIGQGDYFQGQFNYSVGATRYTFFNGGTGNWGMVNGNREAFGVVSDAVYGGCTSTFAVGIGTGCTANGGTLTNLQLTTAWGFNTSYEHYWTPQWHESFSGGYDQISYGTAANAMLCTAAGFGGAGVNGAAATATAGCNNNWNLWYAGSRLQWDVTKTFYLGVEALYIQMNSATTPTGTTGGYTVGSATQTEGKASNWSFTFRAHKDFLP
jgi:hypothetical protein